MCFMSPLRVIKPDKKVQEQLGLRLPALCVRFRTTSSLVLRNTVRIVDGSEFEVIG